MPLLCMPIRAGHKTIVTLPLSRETKWRFGTIFSGTVTGENVWALKRGKSQMSSSATDCVYITGIYENIFFLLLCGCKLAPMPAFPSQPYVPPRTPIGTQVRYNLKVQYTFVPPHSIFTFYQCKKPFWSGKFFIHYALFIKIKIRSLTVYLKNGRRFQNISKSFEFRGHCKK